MHYRKMDKKRLGTKRRPIIALMKNSTKALEAFWGIALSGNIYVPIDAGTPLQRFKTIITILDPVCVIACEEFEDFKGVLDISYVHFDSIYRSETYNEEIINDRLY